jgi:acyl-CoA thioesterase-1
MERLRHILILVLLGIPFFFGCDDQERAEERASAPVKTIQGEKVAKIVALGDSLTAGLGVPLGRSYPALLQQKLADNDYEFQVVNAGVSGETSSGTLSRLNWILGQKPDIVILEIGANDGLRGIDPALVEKNIDEILRKLEESGVVTVLAGMKMVWNLGEEYTKKFNAVYPKLAEQHDLIFMPFFLEDVASESSLNSSDGIHPNEKGYERITENLYPYVVQAIKGLNIRTE